MTRTHLHRIDPATEPRFLRLAQTALDLATGATTVEDLGHRLRDDPETRVTRNLLQDRHDLRRQGDLGVTAAHGGVVPAP